jgi:hypothetical protein
VKGPKAKPKRKRERESSERGKAVAAQTLRPQIVLREAFLLSSLRI